MNSSKLTLDQLQKGVKAKIQGFDDEIIEEKMIEMGCLPGSVVELERIAPLGDPIIIALSEGLLALRKDEAKQISVSALA
ncbi:MAG: ferrous iron transport protein A [Flavobacteriales bacterium]|nr:ferrous iron transport protein A [Flavobacteriales bacterium]